jgi:Xaa-Pro aminopeptidase
MKTYFFFCASLVAFFVSAQQLPTDYLTADFHKGRRDAFRAEMPANSVAVLFSNPVRNRANDVDYIYHQDPDFHYLTGYNEPHAVLLIFSSPQTTPDGNTYKELIFVQERNARAEQWNGRRLGVEGTIASLGFESAYNGSEFAALDINFKSFDKVLFYNFNNDYRDTRDGADLFDLVKSFKNKIGFPTNYNASLQQVYTLIQSTTEKDIQKVVSQLKRYMSRDASLAEDPVVKDFLNAAMQPKDQKIMDRAKTAVNLAINQYNFDLQGLGQIMSGLRETKLPEEMALLKKAIEISAVGQLEVMKAMHPGMSETEVQGVHEYVYKKYGAEYEGYPSIVGGGNNGCILHYIENNKPELGAELVLMDLGAEYHGYTADVTRTIPANGVFSPEQKAIYDIVYNAQEAGIAASVVGAPFSAPGAAASKVVADGLISLGLIKEASEARKYFPHGTSHYLGLDVHDKGTYGPFKANTVITVEPGIYIPEGSDCDPKWWGIAVRIEDDILISDQGPVLLSYMAPRSVEAIEAAMKLPSPLDAFSLPSLE